MLKSQFDDFVVMLNELVRLYVRRGFWNLNPFVKRGVRANYRLEVVVFKVHGKHTWSNTVMFDHLEFARKIICEITVGF